MNFSSNQIGLTQATVYDISAADLAGANSGQRNDLLVKTQAIYRTPDQKLYAANAARSQLVAASTPATVRTDPVSGLVGVGSEAIVFYPIQNLTFANLPSAALNNGVTVRVTDLANSLWESNGTRWRPVNGKAVIKTLPTEFSMSGTTAVKAFESVLPAGCVKDGDTLQLRYTLGKTGTAETCNINVRLGNTGLVSDTALSSFGPLATTNISAGILADYKRLSATSVRKQGNGANNSAFAGQSTAAVNAPVTVASLDAALSYLAIWMNNSAAVETSTMYDCILELVTG